MYLRQIRCLITEAFYIFKTNFSTPKIKPHLALYISVHRFQSARPSYILMIDCGQRKTMECKLLTGLPVELRLRIYEYLLRFDKPVKLRQIIPGSKDLSILRTNQQIYHEALPVLYDLNTIIVTRNDFCKSTDASLKTPLKLDQARHLLIVSFSQSIVCTLNGPGEQCDVCQPSAMGLIGTLISMPRLRTVLVDYHTHLSEIRLFKEKITQHSDLELELIQTIPGSQASRLSGPGLENLDVIFRCGRLS